MMKQLNMHTGRTDVAQVGTPLASDFDIETTIKMANEQMETLKDSYKGAGLSRRHEER